ncbi:sensor domain-containing protein [Streptacidiphilus sp. P02-A3a]|uniref:sensor domain-containing protein n=1 Tax=Streptacidiphilus sp. P02-A3a TaxID=2704468 RepID=UPI0015FA98C2|nr:sensor domain-containing protein [Streptacidiphilus sp. P02-A3a]QMU72802.1 hypothetical protein GXP74_35685 [Streptacidiphilus sp. P02-A3a]
MSSTLDSAGWPYRDDTADRAAARRERPAPGFLAAPFAARSWRETLQGVLNLPVGIVAFCSTVTTISFGLGTVVTVLGLPVLAAVLTGCRGFAAMERSRAAALLGLRVPAPAPPHRRRPGVAGWIRAALSDAPSWRAALYNLLLLPLGIASFTAAVVLWSVAITCASYPLWQWVFPTFVHQPGVQLYEYHGHTHYLSSVPEIAGACALGLVLLFVAPQVLRGLANVQRAMVRGLLSR